MDKREMLTAMEKMLREVEDVVNTQTSLLKKIAQIEADNINLGNKIIDKHISDIMAKADDGLNLATDLQTEFTAAKDKFIVDNKLDEIVPE